jgi:hypothetical protein
MIGIDYGVRRVAVACPSQGWADAMSVKEQRRSAELGALVSFTRACMDRAIREGASRVCPVFVESPIGGASGNMQVAVHMGMTAGAIAACFPGRAHLVAPSSWKALVCGSGRLDKPAVAAWLEREHPSLAEACRKPNGKLDQDRVDATCIGLCTLAGLAERSELSRHRPRSVLRGRRTAADQPS